MSELYASAPIAIRGDLAAAHTRAWERLGRPGAWWDGGQRVAIAAETRHAPACALCQHLGMRVLGKPVGQHTAGRAAANNDVVVISHAFLRLPADYYKRSAPDRSALTTTVTWLGWADR